MLQKLDLISFPVPSDLYVNMMPFVMGDLESLPENMRHYFPLIQQCALTPGEVVYLTVHETWVYEGSYQRRPGIHTDGTSHTPWGGGSWGGSENGKGIYLCSTDGACRAWDVILPESLVDDQGAPTESGRDVLHRSQEVSLDENVLYWMSDRTPHESLRSTQDHYRQFFRLVGSEVEFWFKQHSTANPLGIQPDAKIVTESKF